MLRYRIRRESVDRRYEWHSEESTWSPRGSTLGLGVRGPLPTLPEVQFVVSGAEPGPVEITLYDLQGRLVRRQAFEAGGTGQDSVRLEFGQARPRLRSGVYFARARDRSGRSSEAVRLVVLE
jgi:hypothetical protein